jgi:hypothetical protein
MESREKAERERMKEEDSEPKAPKVSMMNGMNLEVREEARAEAGGDGQWSSGDGEVGR